ncbi:MAG: malate dehydrogenase [Nitrospirae bacterium]|nr:malate dehydrogenase [Nitrospirota bacterium]
MRRRKVTIVGAGNVGANTAQRIVERCIADVVLVDVVDGIPQGKALDILQSAPIIGFDTMIIGATQYDATKGSDIAVITAGLARKPGMSREDLLSANAKIVKGITTELVRYSPDTIIIVVTNPVDLMTFLCAEVSGLPKNRVFGMGGVLDTARFRTFIAMELNVPIKDINAVVLGGHGDAMTPLPRLSTVSGRPLTEMLNTDKIEAIVKRTRDGGAEIVSLLKTGSAYYAPSAAVLEMVEAVLLDNKKILPCSACLNGEYGIKGLYVGAPVQLGKNGVEKVIEITLTEEERIAFDKSVGIVREGVEQIRLLIKIQ